MLRRDRVGYLAIALIVGIIGGVAMGSVAAARRTQSAFPRILMASNPSNLDVDPGGYNPQMLRRISDLPGVASGKTYVALYALRALRSGFADPRTFFNQQVELVGSLDGLYFSQDRVIITSGRRANPRRPGEVVISEQTADRFGLHVGQSLTINLYSGRDASDPRFNPMTRPPVHRVRLTVTGVGVFTDEVVQDDIDRIYRILATPALTRQELDCCAAYAWVGLRLDRGDQDVAAVQREYVKLLPRGTQQAFRVTSAVEGQGERAIRPESVAAGVFGLIAGLAAIVLALQAVRRIIAGGRNERRVLRALGASPLAIGLDICIGVMSAIGPWNPAGCGRCRGPLAAGSAGTASQARARPRHLGRLDCARHGCGVPAAGAGRRDCDACLCRGRTALRAWRSAHPPSGRGDRVRHRWASRLRQRSASALPSSPDQAASPGLRGRASPAPPQRWSSWWARWSSGPASVISFRILRSTAGPGTGRSSLPMATATFRCR